MPSLAMHTQSAPTKITMNLPSLIGGTSTFSSGGGGGGLSKHGTYGSTSDGKKKHHSTLQGYNHDMHPDIRTMMGMYLDAFQAVDVPGICEEVGTSFPNVKDKLVHTDHPHDGNGQNPVWFNHCCRWCS